MSLSNSADALSVIGFFLTLVGLLGSFFYIHLADWLRDVLTLETKWRVNQYGDELDQKAARRACRYEVVQLSNWTTLATSLAVTGFLLLIFILGTILWAAAGDKSLAWAFIGWAGLVFILIYLGMTIALLIIGYRKAHQVQKEVNEYFKKD